LIATCHERRALGWFRVDRVLRAERSDDSFRAAAPAELASFRDRSASGFHRGEPVVVGFRVRAPEAKWVRGVLPLEGASVRELDSGGIEIEAETAGLEVVARFVAGLGDAAVALTPALRARVREIAAGALRVNAELRKGQVVAEEGEARVSGGGGGQ
jgi:predicted DNA-binding transcriptional regulator YafY